jgi:MinD superfamily P-loop ATPase
MLGVDSMRELVVVSGKGGTGKTSLTASFAVLAKQSVIADCDVDAADLHLVLAPRVRRREVFRAGHEAEIKPDLCTGCGLCRELCRFDAVRVEAEGFDRPQFSIDTTACEGCGVCVRSCPEQAIDFPKRVSGEWYVSDTRCGPMVHARLGIAAENSGRLVSIVRQQAREVAEREGKALLLVDGPPGIGCPVIASLTGTSAALVVTEPTLSGEHDMERVLALARHFEIPTAICVNKWDLNADMTARIERGASERGAWTAGRVRYDQGVTAAQIQARTVVETNAPSGNDIRNLWNALLDFLGGTNGSTR